MNNSDKMYPRGCLRSSRIRLTLLLLALLSITSFATASTPTSFCKCTCFSNSTIIPLDPSKSSSGAGTGLKLYERAFTTEELDDDLLQQQQRGKQQEFKIEVDAESESDSDSGNDASGTITERAQTYRALSCNDCNRKFCLDYELPICKDAKEEDIFTTCFQRDSRKDEAVVFIFIFATSGLLAWALLKPWIERYIEAARERRSYVPVGEPES